MGLDMYLYASRHIKKIDWAKLKADESITNFKDVELPDYKLILDIANLNQVEQPNEVYGAEVRVCAIYWRKSNAIHSWFVRHCQNGVDNCESYYVPAEKLVRLSELCRIALDSRDPGILPPQSGFFFGNTEINRWYWDDILYTRTELERIINLPDIKELTFHYESSW